MDIVFTKILGIFGIVFVGYVCCKINWLPGETTKFLSKLLINVASPCIVIMAMAGQELTRQNLLTMGRVCSLTLLFTLASFLLGLAFIKITRGDKESQGVNLFILMFTNNGFLGFPLAATILGQEGLVLMVINNMLTLFLMYTLGLKVIVWGKKRESSFFEGLRQIVSVPVISVVIGLLVFFTQISIPGFLEEAMTNLGNMMVPLSMLIIGIQLGESRIGDIIKNWRLFGVCVLRLAVFPAVALVILMQFDLPKLLVAVITLWLALPGATTASVLAEELGGNPKLAAESIFVTTLFSMATLPLWALILYSYAAL